MFHHGEFRFRQRECVLQRDAVGYSSPGRHGQSIGTWLGIGVFGRGAMLSGQLGDAVEAAVVRFRQAERQFDFPGGSDMVVHIRYTVIPVGERKPGFRRSRNELRQSRIFPLEDNFPGSPTLQTAGTFPDSIYAVQRRD